jgi:hypothetical protein
MKDPNLLLEKLAQAKHDVSAAEVDLERLLAALEVTPRAEKTTVSQVIEDAFTKLRAARVDLADLEKLIAAAVD